jgi:hypothetical protein
VGSPQPKNPALSSEGGGVRRGHFIGPQPVKIHGADIFLLPNPSGRNANFTYAEMLDAFTRLRRWTNRRP